MRFNYKAAIQAKHSILFLLCCIFISCQKLKSRKLVGDYDGIVSSSNWDISGYSFDTSYAKQMQITGSKNAIEIFGKTVLTDSLTYDNYYIEGYYPTQLSLMFTKSDSVYYEFRNGGQGGGGTYSFEGKKVN